MITSALFSVDTKLEDQQTDCYGHCPLVTVNYYNVYTTTGNYQCITGEKPCGWRNLVSDAFSFVF